VDFQSWEACPAGAPAQGEPKGEDGVIATPVTCDKAAVKRDWSIDYYSFRAHLDTKDAFLCSGVTVWNNEDCTGKPFYFLPFDDEPVVQGQCLPDIFDGDYVSVRLECFGFSGGPGDSSDAGSFAGPESSDGPENSYDPENSYGPEDF
jgi:hypothetical protein